MRELIRVLVIDDDAMLAEALGLLFSRHPVFELVGCASDTREAVEMTASERPDVVLMDVELPGIDAVQIVRRIKAARLSTSVVAVTSVNDRAPASELLAVGASACIRKSRAVEDVLDVLRRAAAGEIFPPDVGLADGSDEPSGGIEQSSVAALALGRLTSRETEILRALAAGDSIPGIAEGLRISPLTVENHVKSILMKLGVHSKMEAVMLAWRHGLGRETRTRQVGR